MVHLHDSQFQDLRSRPITDNTNHELASLLVPHLGDDWTAYPEHNWSRLTRLDGLSLTLHTDGKFAVISAAQQETVVGYRYYDGYRTPLPTIRCSVFRRAKDIAADIRRRLLPDVEESYPKECAYIERSNARHRLQQQARQVLAAAGQGHVVNDNGDLVTSGPAFGVRPSWKAKVSPTPEYGIELEINYIDLETAAQILELIATVPSSNCVTA